MRYILLRGMSGFTENVSEHLLVFESLTLEHLSFKITNFLGKKKRDNKKLLV